ncbi:FAD binding domain-containing protein [Pedobacter jejuensis]|uniref:Xanthine dehydrogenase family protein subunit M n=1 Tax=Pedobacter jejuensis TaxID=1268550 RepID=A0A3N0BVN3_9SPHI|nr:xanthine dehydrogenase family protein subunit M [Pedobacter jejuensis]RNL53446.1 xanthine dehydrogenase family protein subunit M [Pedobacter jejuensis]
MNNFDYQKAATVSDVVGKSTFVAGGTNLIDLLKYNLTNAATLIDINTIGEHHDILEIEDGVRLGALATNADTAYHPIIEQRYPLLSRAILAGASAQIRNMATNGGNLLQRTRCYYFYDPHAPCNKRLPGSGCSAINGYNRNMAILGTSENCIAVFPSDMSIALSALDAIINIKSEDGERSVDFADFHRLPGDTPPIDNNLKPGEFITSIDLPLKGFAKNYSYLKLRDRASYAFALVSVATGLELDGDTIRDVRITLGGVSHKPWRVKDAEHYLIGKKADRENFSAAADIILQGAVGFAHNTFKIKLAKKAIVRNCMMALDPSTQLPGAQPSA